MGWLLMGALQCNYYDRCDFITKKKLLFPGTERKTASKNKQWNPAGVFYLTQQAASIPSKEELVHVT